MGLRCARQGGGWCGHDHLARNEEVQARLAQTDWDLIVCDEAHKMSASYFGREVKETKRYKLGKLLSGLCRHFLLLTATPHNGKEADFQLFMALLDGDRFEGRFRAGVHQVDTTDLMRRLVKEQLLKFDGTPLFPERLAYTVNYTLSDLEAALYREVTAYVREQMNRADRLTRAGEKRRGTTVGFALTILQRRLASSPEAISQSLRRWHERLEKRLRKCMEELQQELPVSALPPVVAGGALVVPAGALSSRVVSPDGVDAAARRAEVERMAMEAVMAVERRLGRIPTDVGARKLGYDVESEVPGEGRLLFIEVKGRADGADTVTVTKNEILTALNMPDDFILAIVEVDGRAHEPRYLRQPFRHEPDFEVTSVTYALRELLAQAEEPS
jgi:Domain of unknown function (DUF3883)